MRWHRAVIVSLVCLPAAWLAGAGPAGAQAPALSDSECQTLRTRLGDHAKLSPGVRRAVASRVGAPPPSASPVTSTAPAAPAAGSAEAIRARLAEIPAQRDALETQRLGAMVKFDFAQAGQIQAKIQALDAEKASLEQKLATAPTAAATPTPSVPSPAPVVAADDASRIPCQDVRAALDSAVRIRQGELGGHEGQANVVPLVAFKGQSSDEIARELGAQFPAPVAGTTSVGLLDVDGDARIDGVVDVPVAGVYRLVRRRTDGTLGIDVFAASGAGSGYGDLTRRVDEQTLQRTGQTLESLLAVRGAGPVRVIAETGDFGRAQSRLLAGDPAEAARIEGAAARSLEFKNFRNEPVRVMEIITPAGGGVDVRRVIVLSPANTNESWDEMTTAMRPVSYWRTDIEVARAQETRTTAGAAVGGRSATGPFKFSVER